MKKTKRVISLFLTIQMLLACVLIPNVMAMDVVSEDNYVEELMPRSAIPCYSSVAAGLDYYIGSGNWSYDANGNPTADGFNINVASNGVCYVSGDDVSYSFRYR